MMICYGVGFSTCFVLRFYLVWENRRRDRVAVGDGAEDDEHTAVNLSDKTDQEMARFRYVY